MILLEIPPHVGAWPEALIKISVTVSRNDSWSQPGIPRINEVQPKLDGTMICAPNPERTCFAIALATSSAVTGVSFNFPPSVRFAIMGVATQVGCTTL